MRWGVSRDYGALETALKALRSLLSSRWTPSNRGSDGLLPMVTSIGVGRSVDYLMHRWSDRPMSMTPTDGSGR